jgi:hypothetical protein
MKDIEKLDQMATYLAEIMLSQLGFSFIPSVRPNVVRLRTGGIFTVSVGFLEEEVQEIPFFYYESLNFVSGENNYGRYYSN